jgi:hypothetical protein
MLDIAGFANYFVTKDIWYSEHIKKSPETYHLVLLRNPWRSNVVHLMFFSSVSLGLQVALYLFKFFFVYFSLGIAFFENINSFGSPTWDILLALCGLDQPFDEKDKTDYHQDPKDEHKDHTKPSHPPSPHHSRTYAPTTIVASLLSKNVICIR